MRRVLDDKAANLGGSADDAGGKAAEKVTTKAAPSGPRMQTPAAFDLQVATNRFGDPNKPVDAAELTRVLGSVRLGEMIARVADPKVRSVAHSPTETVAPLALYSAVRLRQREDLDLHPNKPANPDKAYIDAVEWGRDLLLDVRSQRSYTLFGKVRAGVDVIAKVGTWDAEVLLARELAKRPELGGTSILMDALNRCYFPSDIEKRIEGQLKSIAPVASTVPAPPASAVATRLDDIGIVDALLLGDQAYCAAIAAARTGDKKRHFPTSNLNLRDQAASPMVLTEVFGRLSAQFTSDFTPYARQVLLMTGRLAASKDVSAVIKKAAFLGINAALKRHHAEALAAKSKGSPATIPPYASLAQLLMAARTKFSAEVIDLTNRRQPAEQSKLALDAVNEIIGEVFRQEDDPLFAVETMSGSTDPGSILLRTMLDTASRDRIVNGILTGAATNPARIALMGDRSHREAELRKLATADKNFRPNGEIAALRLSWPSDLPLPTFDAALDAARTEDVKTFGVGHNLKALIDKPAAPQEIFDEILRVSAATKFHVHADDKSMNDTVRQLIAGDIDIKGGLIRKHDHTQLLLDSPALAALPLQIQNGATPEHVLGRIQRAVQTSNAALLTVLPGLLKDPKSKITFKTVLEGFRKVMKEADGTPKKDPDGNTLYESMVSPGPADQGGNAVFAYAVLALCKQTLGTAIDNEVALACQDLLKRTGVVSLAPYAGLKPDDSLVILTKEFPEGLKPDSPHYMPLLDVLELPPKALSAIVSRPDLATFPPQTLFEVFARSLKDDSVTKADFARLAVAGATCRAELTGELSGNNIWATFNELASRGYDDAFGKLILDGLVERLAKAKEALADDATKRAADTDYAAKNPQHKPMPSLDPVYRAAAMLAADKKLFKADDVAAAVLALEPASGEALIQELALRAPQFFDALSDPMRNQVMERALKSIGSATDATVLDNARPCFAWVADMKKRGVTVDAAILKVMDGMVESALMRSATNPLEVAGLSKLLLDARNSGVNVEAIANQLIADPSKAKAAAGLTPSQLAAVRLEVARLVPAADVTVLKSIVLKQAPGPFAAAFDLVADRDRALSDEVTKGVCRGAIDWAAGEKAFASVVSFRQRLVDQGLNERLAIFDSTLTEAMKSQPKVWEGVAEVRALAAASKLEELRAEMYELAEGGKDAEARAVALADRIASAGPYAAELVDPVISGVRRAARAMRPTLDDVQFGLNVSFNASDAIKSSAPAVKTVDCFGVPLLAYDGPTGHADPPPFAKFTPTPSAMRNLKIFDETMRHPHPFAKLQGPPGTAKSFTARMWAHLTGTPYLQINGGPQRRTNEFSGYWGSDPKGMPFYERADFLEVYTKGGLIVIDEFQASSDAVLDQLAEFASRLEKKVFMRTNRNEPVERSPHARIVVIGNFLDKKIPDILRNSALNIYFDQMPLEDQKQIAADVAPSLSPNELDQLARMQMLVEDIVTFHNLGTKVPLSVRNLKRAARRAEEYRGDALGIARAARESYLDGISDPTARSLIAAGFEKPELFGIKPEATVKAPADIEIRQTHGAVVIGEAVVKHGTKTPVAPSAVKHGNFGRQIPLFLGDRERRELEQMGKAIQNNENLLYFAKQESGLRTIVESMAQMAGLEVVEKEVHREITGNDLYGANTQVAVNDKDFETVWEDGLINSVTKGPCLVVIRNFHKLTEGTQISTHQMLEERKVPSKNGKLVDMHPQATVILTAEPGARLGGAVMNRCTIRTLEPKSQSEMLERLSAIGEAMGLPEDAKDTPGQMMRTFGLWNRMVGTTISEWLPRTNLALPGMGTMIDWLAQVTDVLTGRKTDVPGDGFDEQVKNAFIKYGVNAFHVPGGRKVDDKGKAILPDDQRVEAMITAIHAGDNAKVKELTGIDEQKEAEEAKKAKAAKP